MFPRATARKSIIGCPWSPPGKAPGAPGSDGPRGLKAAAAGCPAKASCDRTELAPLVGGLPSMPCRLSGLPVPDNILDGGSSPGSPGNPGSPGKPGMFIKAEGEMAPNGLPGPGAPEPRLRSIWAAAEACACATAA